MKALALGCLVLTACTADEVTLGETAQAAKSPGFEDDGTCPEWGCGSNSPIVEAAWFHELHELGLPNLQGFRLTHFQKQTAPGIWRSYYPDVQNGILRAVSRVDNATVIWQNNDLLGMRFVVEHPAGFTIHIYIQAIGSAAMWAHPPGMPAAFARIRARTYELRWQYPNVVMHRIALCGATPSPDGINQFHAVLFEEDRIDADALVVTGETRNWFNIGCQGHTLAKMHLMGHTKASAAYIGGATTTLDERTAILKMFAGDYCGNGNPFTVAGVPIKFRDNHFWYRDIPLSNNDYDIEARWDENGAICLNVPRIDFQGGAPAFPGGVEDMMLPTDEWCTEENPRPPPCLGDDVSNFWGGHLISANPMN